jgi:serine/threonine protein kinase HipA of HipAB toxin-antitoxin module
MVSFRDQDLNGQAGLTFTDDINQEYIFYQRIQLLAVMARALAEGRLKGYFRENALKENLNRICEALIFNFNVKDVKFLKVA